MVSVLFVCTGNICRSPTAEAVFRARIRKKGVSASYDSAGTFGYHIGEPPDHRAIQAARDHGIDMSDIVARKINDNDFESFDYIIAMDKGHERTMRRMIPETYHSKIKLFLDFHDQYKGMDIPDPYYGDREGFQKTYDLIEEGVDALITEIL